MKRKIIKIIEKEGILGNESPSNSSEIVGLIGLKQVREWIQFKNLEQEAELELHTLFPKQRDLRQKAVSLLRDLSHNPMKQAQIIEQLFDDDKRAASRFLGQLEAYHYISRTYDGKEKIVVLGGETFGNKME